MTAEVVARAPRVAERTDVTPERFTQDILTAYEPVVLRGLVAGWPAVAAGLRSHEEMARYLLTMDSGEPASVMIGQPKIDGRFFYRDDMSGFNFERAKVTLPVLLQQLLAQQDDVDAPALYAGAAPMAKNFPRWPQANPLPLPTPNALPRVWVGTASRVSTHYDVSSNVAAVVAGRRRFALFPPAQGENLYVGPLDVTVAGQPTSMVDLEAADLDRYPRFARALETMLVAELEPGDAIYIPPMWWHDVRASGPLNVLVNYWWSRPGEAAPFAALIHALLAVRDLPADERASVRAWFDMYVFGEDAHAVGDHLPPHMRGVLGHPSPERTRAMRDYVMAALKQL